LQKQQQLDFFQVVSLGNLTHFRVAKTTTKAMLTTRRMKRVLVVDDQSDCSEPMARLLKLCGFDAQTAANGRDALDKLHQWAADLVLLDLMMPIMDGFAFLEAIRNQPEFSSLPVIVFSAWDNETTRYRLQRLGVASTYRKADTDFDTMVSQIKQLVGA